MQFKVLSTTYEGVWRAETGDEEFDQEHDEQMRCSSKDVARAINELKLADDIFHRICANKQASFLQMMQRVNPRPGTE